MPTARTRTTKKSKPRLGTSLKQMSRAVESSSASIIITDKTGAIQYVNPKFTEITGYTLRQVLGKNPRILKSGQTPPETYVDLWGTITKGRQWRGEFCNRKKNGELYWEKASISPVTNRAGKITHYVAVKEDITARRQADRELTIALAKYKTLFDSFPLGITVLDKQGQVVETNRMADRILGISHEEHLRRAIDSPRWNTVRPDGTPMPPEEFPGRRALLENRRFENVEMGLVKASGETTWLSVTAAPLPLGEYGAVVAYTDVTVRKQEHEMLSAYAIEIAQKNAELAVARDEALDAARIKSYYLTTMSHEIRTPLTALIGMTELLLDTSLTREQLEFARSIESSGEILLSLINDLLDFSKIEAGKLVLNRMAFQPLALVEKTVDLFTTHARAKNLALMSYVGPRVPAWLYGDEKRLRQVLLNLVSNSVKFTEHGQVVVRAVVEEETRTSVRLKVTVSDTGVGISEALSARLFEPFTQAEGPITRKHGGTGLGLAISKRLIDLMGGEIDVESREGRGATFRFSVPLEQVAMPSEAPPALSPAGDRGAVLVVDENTVQREILDLYIRTLGMETTGAPSGERALAALRRAAEAGHPYALVITAFRLPGMDGAAVARTIRQDPALAATPVLMMTAFDERGQGEQDGVSAYLRKPLKRTELLAAIVRLLTSPPR